MSVNQQVNTKNQFTLLGYGYDAAGNARRAPERKPAA
jgi:hypothetical protein